MIPILSALMRHTQTLPCLSSARPYGPPDILYSVIFPLVRSSLPTEPDWFVNQIVPVSSITSVCGLPPEGVRCSVTLPVEGSSSPIVPLPLPVYQTLPSLSTDRKSTRLNSSHVKS